MRFLKTCCSIVSSMLITMCLVQTALAATTATDNNRFNVMVVLDASGSMNSTDPNDLRFEAINLFTNLLAEHGNYLGCIVFSTDISAKMEPIAINSQQDKNQITQLLQSVPAAGWTNTGDALLAAVESVERNGDSSLPSVIVFLSDGNTDMGSKDKTNASLDTKAEAIQRARENEISIFSVCLNSDKTADTTEMDQISKATGGVFQDVGSAEDLSDVFNTFYNLIYGTSTIMLVDETFPASGIVEKQFEVPGIGVEEVNIIIYGKTQNLALFKPDGTESESDTLTMSTFNMIKITDVEPGVWRVVTTGIPGDQIKINMVYNTNLGVDINTLNENVITTDDDIVVTATLHSSIEAATTAEQYSGYSSELHILDAYGDELEVVTMKVVGDHFEVNQKLGEGTYYFKASVSGNYIFRESDTIGPLRVVVAEHIEEVIEEVNTPPEAIENPIQKTVNIWPFKDASLDIDLNTLAVDEQDTKLRYKIISSSFIEETDYSVSPDGVLTINHFSLSKGAFTVRAIDSGGLFCNIEIIVTSHNIGIMALIGIGIASAIGLIIFGILLYIAFNKRFMGACYVTPFDSEGNYYEEVKREKGRGRIRLSSFGIKNVGFDASKCYFQASGKNYVYFVTNKKVFGNGALSKKIRVDGNGFEVTISTDQYSLSGVRVKFVSRLNNTNYAF